MHIQCGVTGKWGGAKHLQELKTYGGNADITRVMRRTNPKHLNGSNYGVLSAIVGETGK